MKDKTFSSSQLNDFFIGRNIIFSLIITSRIIMLVRHVLNLIEKTIQRTSLLFIHRSKNAHLL